MKDAEGKYFFVGPARVGVLQFWDFFAGDWQDVIDSTNTSLREQGRKLIERYKAADCSSRVGDFEGWTVDEQRLLTARLLESSTNQPML